MFDIPSARIPRNNIKSEVLNVNKESCRHEFQHMDSKKHKEGRSFGLPTWYRVDQFYCTKCLEIQTKKRSDSDWNQPEWY